MTAMLLAWPSASRQAGEERLIGKQAARKRRKKKKPPSNSQSQPGRWAAPAVRRVGNALRSRAPRPAYVTDGDVAPPRPGSCAARPQVTLSAPSLG